MMRHRWSWCEVTATAIAVLVAIHIVMTGMFYTAARLGQIEIIHNQEVILSKLDSLLRK